MDIYIEYLSEIFQRTNHVIRRTRYRIMISRISFIIFTKEFYLSRSHDIFYLFQSNIKATIPSQVQTSATTTVTSIPPGFSIPSNYITNIDNTSKNETLITSQVTSYPHLTQINPVDTGATTTNSTIHPSNQPIVTASSSK